MAAAAAPLAVVRLLHLSDTHRRLDAAAAWLPEADVLVHTGDFANDGKAPGEFAAFDEALAAEGIPGMGPELLGDEAWMDLFNPGPIAENPDLILIDVRTPGEVEEKGHIEGAVNIPLREVLERIGRDRISVLPGAPALYQSLLEITTVPELARLVVPVTAEGLSSSDAAPESPPAEVESEAPAAAKAKAAPEKKPVVKKRKPAPSAKIISKPETETDDAAPEIAESEAAGIDAVAEIRARLA